MTQAPAATADARLFEEVTVALRQNPKMLPSKLFYDTRGAALFEQIMTLPEYYPTRTELGILDKNAQAISTWIGPQARIVEFGSGSGDKTRLLLEHLTSPSEYLPIDIAATQLNVFAASLRLDFPDLRVRPIVADYTRGLRLPPRAPESGRTIVFFPGSTIGNFEPDAASEFLQAAAQLSGSGAGLLIGVDLKKDPALIERAYNDEAGVTAAFNRNILKHVNGLFRGTFDPAAFHHRAFYNTARGRIEMRLVSASAQRATLHGPDGREATFDFAQGEELVTEYSYKYTVEEFVRLAQAVGFRWRHTWTDGAQLFGELAFDVERV